MTNTICLDEKYSTMRLLIQADPTVITSEVQQSYRPEDKFETVLFLPVGENRKVEGGTPTASYMSLSIETLSSSQAENDTDPRHCEGQGDAEIPAICLSYSPLMKLKATKIQTLKLIIDVSIREQILQNAELTLSVLRNIGSHKTKNSSASARSAMCSMPSSANGDTI